MKKLLILLILLLKSFNFFSQNDESILKMTLISEVKKEPNDSISISPFWVSNEITNKDYRNFLNDIMEDGNKQFVSEMKEFFKNDQLPTDEQIIPHLIDSLALSKQFGYKSKYYKRYQKYFTKQKYDNYPVVGVSNLGAKYYCMWLTDTETLIKLLKIMDTIKLPKGGVPGIISAKYRLPNEKESKLIIQTKILNASKTISKLEGLDKKNSSVLNDVTSKVYENIGFRVVKSARANKN